MQRGKGLKMGTDLKAIMKKEGITAYRLSKEIGIGESYMSKILNDKANPNCVTLKRILDFLGYEVSFKKVSKERR